MTQKDSGAPSLAVVVPYYNEEDVLAETSRRLSLVLDALAAEGKLSNNGALYFVDDGSTDRTWELIERLSAENPNILGIKLSRNRGHQNALLAGLFTAEGDAVVSIDADLQDDVGAIPQMVDKFLGGTEIVYGVRKNRGTDSWFKRRTAALFYAIMRLLGAESISDHADFRLMSRRAIEALKTYREVNLYVRGIVPLLGLRSEIVYFDRAKRFAGTSKYPLWKMMGLALEAITSFSVVPLRLITLIGFLVFIVSLVVSAWVVWVRFASDLAVPGWASVVLPMYLLGGIQLFYIGILGEYLGKTYSEVKNRPRYLIEKITASAERVSANADGRSGD
jgi:glycosyltransferase involved in cell wall biosynthesis